MSKNLSGDYLKDSITLHFVPLGAHLVYIGHQCRANGRPWTQNVGPWKVEMTFQKIEYWLYMYRVFQRMMNFGEV